MNQEIKNCQRCSKDFTLDGDELGFYEKMKVPAPKVCPDCRFKMRAMFRNETTLYTGRNCGLCKKAVISMYNPNSPYIIYCHDCFYSEKWEARDYAKEYDFKRPFLEQMKEFLISVPKINLFLNSSDGPNLNSEYVNMAGGCKNCYLVFNTSPAEDLLYSRGIKNGRDSSDLYFGVTMERSYESVNIQQSAGIVFGQNVVSCVDSMFILNGSGLTDCFGCVNLRNKSHYFFNEQLSNDEYKKKVLEVMGSYEKMEETRKKFEAFSLKFPRRESNSIKNVNSTGDYLFECRNVQDSFEVAKGENCRHLFSSKEIKDSIGTIGYGYRCENLLEVVATGYSSNIVGTYAADNSRDILYGFYVNNCQDCVGCDGLKNGKYSIFNKEYEKEEYEKIREHVINELIEKDLYGLMMPQELAPFAYNESIAQDNFPLSKEEAIAQGFRWEDDIQKTAGKETMEPEKVPDHIKDVQDSITKEVLRCIDCNRNYKIINQELAFYRKMNLPIPRKCFYCRHQDRILRRGPYKFWDRNCAKCQKGIITNYSPDRPEIVYCEKCYQQEVY